MILEALERLYERLDARGDAESTGWAKVGVEWTIVLSVQGEPVAVERNVELQGGKPRAKLLSVPAPVKRTKAVAPNTLWDKSSYVLGRTAAEGRRASMEHAAFKAAALELIGDSNDDGLVALRRFLERWTPECFDAPPFSTSMLDGNFAFKLEGDRDHLHTRPAARARLRKEVDTVEAAQVCLVTGVRAAPLRLHPSIKGVNGAQVSGASLVSFNLEAFRSFGRRQGANAPISEAAGERYGAALNTLLSRDSPHRLPFPVGDATVVFWAEAHGDEAAAVAAERRLRALLAPKAGAETNNVTGSEQEPETDGEAAAHSAPLAASPDTRVYLLGLAPNAARLAVRFWVSGALGSVSAALEAHASDLTIRPRPHGWGSEPPALWRLLLKTTALQERFENVPATLAGEAARAVFTGARYPSTWLSTIIIRLRGGDGLNGWHAAVIKACLNRHPDEEDLPVALEPAHDNIAYQLGRLLAAIEAARYAAVGRSVVTVADRYFARASSAPARTFAMLLRGARADVVAAKRRGVGLGVDKRLGEIVARLPADLPKTLRLEDQGRFAVGYYHERATRLADATAAQEPAAPPATLDQGPHR